MKRTISHRDREKPCEFLQRDQRGHWQCRLLQFSGQPVAIVTPHGRLEWVTSSAQDILQRYWPNRPVLETRLPLQIRTWLNKAQKRPGVGKGVAQEPSPLVIHQPPGRLVVRTMHDGTFTALLFEEFLSDLPVVRLAALGLTPREAEVLQWLAQGKSSPEIAIILGISSRTVSKHLTRVYQQLGVENRHAAIATALDAVRSHKGSDDKRLTRH